MLAYVQVSCFRLMLPVTPPMLRVYFMIACHLYGTGHRSLRPDFATRVLDTKLLRNGAGTAQETAHTFPWHRGCLSSK